MIEKTKLGKVGWLAGFEADCADCGRRARIVRSVVVEYAMGGGGDAVYGGQCDRCTTILWTRAVQDSILTRLGGVPPEGMDAEEYRKRIQDAYLASLPACPVCGNAGHGVFVDTELPRQGTPCGSCSAPLPPFRGYVRDMLEDDVYFYYESDAAADSARRFRSAFHRWESLI